MSRARHKARAEGGSVSEASKKLDLNERSPKPDWNAGEEQNAAKEAMEKKRGGRVKGEGESSKKRMDRRGRARGGRIGSNLAPLSTAARVKHVTKGEQPEDGTQ